MSTQPVCGKCGGTGWIIIERANVSGAEPCECRNAGRSDRIEGRSQIPPLYSNTDFDTFKHDGNPDLKAVMTLVKNFADEFPLGPTRDCC